MHRQKLFITGALQNEKVNERILHALVFGSN